MHSQRCGTQKSMIHVFPERHLKGVMGAERGGAGGGPGLPGRWGQRSDGLRSLSLASCPQHTRRR